jgi:hypothetical protein
MGWKKYALKHSQTFSCARFEFIDMLLESLAGRKTPYQSTALSLPRMTTIDFSAFQ